MKSSPPAGPDVTRSGWPTRPGRRSGQVAHFASCLPCAANELPLHLKGDFSSFFHTRPLGIQNVSLPWCVRNTVYFCRAHALVKARHGIVSPWVGGWQFVAVHVLIQHGSPVRAAQWSAERSVEHGWRLHGCIAGGGEHVAWLSDDRPSSCKTTRNLPTVYTTMLVHGNFMHHVGAGAGSSHGGSGGHQSLHCGMSAGTLNMTRPRSSWPGLTDFLTRHQQVHLGHDWPCPRPGLRYSLSDEAQWMRFRPSIGQVQPLPLSHSRAGVQRSISYFETPTPRPGLTAPA